MPLDKRVFGFPYDDVELLGKAVTRGPAWRAIGLALHLQNGAIFGAVYANVAPSVPLPSWARGPLAGLVEHLSSWPLTAMSDRVHPARRQMPALAGNGRALAQGTWRHVLFGVVLGELERRLNPELESELPPFTGAISSNGHGNLERAAVSEAP
jgi:hypothetical protein